MSNLIGKMMDWLYDNGQSTPNDSPAQRQYGNVDPFGLDAIDRRNQKVARAKAMHDAGFYRSRVQRARHKAFLKKVQREARKEMGG